jgi:3-dehydroquinate synthase
MRKTIQKITVSYEYEVLFTSKLFDNNNSTLQDVIMKITPPHLPHRIMFVIEKALINHYPDLPRQINNYCETRSDKILITSPPTAIKGGESFKNFSKIESLCRLFAENNLCRHSYAAIIGGGAFLDSVGLAASLVHRGIRQIRIPTTVLSQCDSGVGVKTGINMFGKKNFAGTFAPPYAVVNNSDFLKTLEYRDWISGVTEALKVAMIKDAEFFNWLILNSAKFAQRNMPAMVKLIEKCAELHMKHIATSGDPFEFGSARPLDFGHWSAHKLETLTNGKLRHGEAVGIGILLDSYYAVKTGNLKEKTLNQLIKAYKTMKLPIYNTHLSEEKENGKLAIFDGIEEFREHLGGELNITIPNQLGYKKEISNIDKNILKKGISFLHDISKLN